MTLVTHFQYPGHNNNVYPMYHTVPAKRNNDYHQIQNGILMGG